MVKIKMGDLMKAFGKKILTGITALFITVSSILASTGTIVAADETRPDDPNDGIVTASERKTDLLSEVHEDAPEISASSYILYDATSGTILLGSDYDVQKEPASMTKVMTTCEYISFTPFTRFDTPSDVNAASPASFPTIQQDNFTSLAPAKTEPDRRIQRAAIPCRITCQPLLPMSRNSV